MTERWDVVVVGAGPAGASAALAALQRRPAARVLLLDREDFPRDKSCGDAVAPHTADLLEQLGAAHVLGDREPVWDLSMSMPASPQPQRRMQRPVRVIPRTLLDQRLVQAAQARGAVLRRHRVRTVQIRADGVVVDGELHAQVVVGADGAESVVRRQLDLAANPPGHVAVAIRAYAPSRSSAARVVANGRDWPAYAWSVPMGDGWANVGYGEVLRGRGTVTRADLLDRLAALLPGASADAVSWRAHRLPLSTKRPRQPDGRVMLVGDAASLVNPMSGEGIFYAVLSGQSAGQAAALGPAAGAAHREAMDAGLGRHLRATAAGVRLARLPALAAVGLRIGSRHQAVFDWYVDVGIGAGEVDARRAASAAVRALAPTATLSREHR